MKNEIDVNYAINVTDDNSNIIHICLYENEPSTEDINHLKEELTNDSEFGIGDISNLTFTVNKIED